ncbi:PREDICTED: transcription factor Sox-10-like [Polistes dominula]|uniref:Sex-determining region Y protein n=1 Tax=Polistes dominula TaxID=743375 RepID=A0ABM1IIL4_POLDO|nr:PREDICTED: transcription factor Sox-10-like [Polistes dominula]
MDNRGCECVVQKDNTKRDSRNIKPNILSPISTKKEAIYLSNYHNYRGKNCNKNSNNNNNTINSNNIVIEKRSFDLFKKKSIVVKDDKENRTKNFTSPVNKQQGILQTLLSYDEKNNNGGNLLKRKIPRPANAFMLFANEWRKKLANENPRESNKDISVRLGILWKNISQDVKERYFTLAREVDAEHKKKYPGKCFILYFNNFPMLGEKDNKL